MLKKKIYYNVKSEMKEKFIILFLLFSSSAFAGDNLTGKKIICGFFDDDSQIVKVNAWDFISDDRVLFYPKMWEYNYEAGPTSIFIYYDNKNTIRNKISRKNLEVTYTHYTAGSEQQILYKSEECKISEVKDTEEGISSFKEDILIQLKKDNLL